MDFKDYRVAPTTTGEQPEQEASPKRSRYRGKHFYDYLDEIIQGAVERGEFDNLSGAGKPLNLDDENPYAGDKAVGYHLLKQNGYAPPEIELHKEIRRERERVEQKLDSLRARGKLLRSRKVPPFESEKRAYNSAVENALASYDEHLRQLNRKILTFNLSVPLLMHLPLLHVEQLVQQYRESCPLL